jgi:hypothetical protein
VIAINPRHRNFYQKVLGFVPLGERPSCPTVQDHPAEAHVLDLELMRDGAPKMYSEVFSEELPASVLTAGCSSAATSWSPDGAGDRQPAGTEPVGIRSLRGKARVLAR